MIAANVNLTASRFDRVIASNEQRVKHALAVGAREGAAEASRVAGSRRRSGKMSDFEVIEPRGDVDGFTAGFRNDPKAWWERYQNDGTLSHRSAERGSGSGLKPLKAQTLRRRSTPSGQERFGKVSGNAGIEPLRFFEKGRAAARKAIRRELGIR